MRAIFLLFLLNPQAFASIPSKILPPVFEDLAKALALPQTQNNLALATPDDWIRVSLGEYRFALLKGEDLRIDGRSIGAGTVEVSLRCQSKSEFPINVVGVGRSKSPITIESPTGFVYFQRRTFRSKMTIYSQDDMCLVVNSLPMDHYLAGLLNKEMSPSWPLEALKAQAIASRTYALYQKRRSQLRFYDVENTTQDQVYDGSESETPRSYSAVQATSKLLLTWNAEPIKAFYHANCGGSTESPAAVWGNGYSYFRPVQCPYHHGGAGTQMRWNVSFSKIQLQNALKKISGLLPLKFSRLAWVEAGPLNPHDRREVIKITDNIGKQVLISSNSFRNALGNTRVKSTAFSLQNDGETILLRGKGFGHGVGLCQIGAREMAKQGKSFRDILALYYSFAKLKAY